MKPAIKPSMKLGAEPKKLAVLLILLAIAGVAYYISSSGTTGGYSGGSTPVAVAPPPAQPGVFTPVNTGSRARAGRGRNRGSGSQEFRPTLKPKDPIDPSRVDPTLRLDLLAKLKTVKPEAGARSLFDFGAAPPPVQIASIHPIVPGHVDRWAIGPKKPLPPPPPPLPPPPPPIPLKFFGYSAAENQGPKRAFFLEGDNIFVATEGQLIKNRYKVIHIGVNSVVVEDTANKHQQTLPLLPERIEG
jgi:hypothetical protein